MILLRNHFTTLPALAVTGLLLLAFVVVTIRTATAQTTTTPTCATGTAVPDPDNNPGLVSDCEALITSRDTLAGDATLNWSADLPVEEWEGITVEGTPKRVTGLVLRDSGLTGEIPSELARLSSLEELRLHYNQLIGAIPSELGSLSRLKALVIIGSQLSGEIPPELGGLSKLEELSLSDNRTTLPSLI